MAAVLEAVVDLPTHSTLLSGLVSALPAPDGLATTLVLLADKAAGIAEAANSSASLWMQERASKLTDVVSTEEVGCSCMQWSSRSILTHLT